jgi:uncharacterized protein (TIGR02145 family)
VKYKDLISTTVQSFTDYIKIYTMKRKLLTIGSLIIACLTLSSWIKNSQVFNSNNNYPEVVIGNQIWMAENLNVITFRNGDTIREARTIDEWRAAASKKKPAWCYYNNDSSNQSKHGKIYNFYAVSDPRGLAPNGWKIPRGNDWVELSDFLGGKRTAGGKMKTNTGWKKNGNGTNSSGFSASPSGSREPAMINRNNGFMGMGGLCYWWSSTKRKGGEVLVFSLIWSNNKLKPVWDTFGADGYSVRCIKK